MSVIRKWNLNEIFVMVLMHCIYFKYTVNRFIYLSLIIQFIKCSYIFTNWILHVQQEAIKHVHIFYQIKCSCFHYIMIHFFCVYLLLLIIYCWFISVCFFFKTVAHKNCFEESIHTFFHTTRVKHYRKTT